MNHKHLVHYRIDPMYSIIVELVFYTRSRLYKNCIEQGNFNLFFNAEGIYQLGVD